uniref:CYtochrome P450 family n=1 Tax=Caenorhabditis tropicalis TaxID=1561998 RepID=A0A1I7T6Q9_9PELO
MIFLITFFAIVIISLVFQFRKSSRLPPGPLSLPLIGNIHQLVYQVWQRKGIAAALDHYRKIYGNAFTIWLGPIPSVSITDFETSHEVFVKNGKKCADRQIAPIFEHITGGFGLLSANGEGWAEMRRFTLLAFRRLGVGSNQIERRIMAELNGRCSELDLEITQNGRAIVSVDFFDLTVGSVINSLLVGKRFEEDTKDDYLTLKHLFDASAETFSLFDLSVPVWFLKWFFPSRFQMTCDVRQKILNHVAKEAVDRQRRLESGEYEINSEDPKDFVDVFLDKIKEENKIKKDSNPSYTMESLKYMLVDLWLAGQGTTSTTLYAGFMKLVQHPEIIQKIREELLEVTEGKRDLKLEDRRNTPYLNATIAEIQRHASILNVNFWRINNEKISFGGYEVEPGALIAAQLGAFHVREDTFENPNEFNPDKFLKNEQLIQQLIPFGIGKRSCVGEQIAKSELYLVFGNLILRYDMKADGPIPTNGDFYPYSSARLPDTSGKMQFTKF